MTKGDLARYSSHHRIASVERESRLARVVWDDGHVSEFHYAWLRDNCFCPECRHPHALERKVDLLALPGKIRPAAVIVQESGALRITWQGDGHVSAYKPGCLRAHCYSDESRASRRWRPVLWDADLGNNMPAVDYDDIKESEAGVLAWLRMLRDCGVSLICNAPTRVSMAAMRRMPKV